MPRVPTYQQQVSARAMPGVRQSTNVSADSFGAQQAGWDMRKGQAMEAIGDSMANNSNRAMDIATSFKVRAERALVRDRVNKLRADLDKHELELRKRQGEHAFNAESEMKNFIEEQKKAYYRSSKLSPRMREMLDSNFSTVSQPYQRRAYSHQIQEIEKFDMATLEAENAQAITDIRNRPTDADTMALALSEIEQNTISLYRDKLGLPANAVRGKLKEAYRNAHMQALTVMLDQEQFGPARARLDQIEDLYNPKDKDGKRKGESLLDPAWKAKFRADLDRAEIPVKAAAIVSKLKDLPQKEQWKAVDAVREENPDLANVIDRQLSIWHNRKTAMRSERDDKITSAYLDQIWKNPTLDNVKNAIPKGISGDLKWDLYTKGLRAVDASMKRAALGRGPEIKDSKDYSLAKEMVRLDPERFDITQFREVLSPKSMRRLKLYHDFHLGKAKPKEAASEKALEGFLSDVAPILKASHKLSWEKNPALFARMLSKAEERYREEQDEDGKIPMDKKRSLFVEIATMDPDKFEDDLESAGELNEEGKYLIDTTTSPDGLTESVHFRDRSGADVRTLQKKFFRHENSKEFKDWLEKGGYDKHEFRNGEVIGYKLAQSRKSMIAGKIAGSIPFIDPISKPGMRSFAMKAFKEYIEAGRFDPRHTESYERFLDSNLKHPGVQARFDHETGRAYVYDRGFFEQKLLNVQAGVKEKDPAAARAEYVIDDRTGDRFRPAEQRIEDGVLIRILYDRDGNPRTARIPVKKKGTDK